jgi:hypothetical protein
VWRKKEAHLGVKEFHNQILFILLVVQVKTMLQQLCTIYCELCVQGIGQLLIVDTQVYLCFWIEAVYYIHFPPLCKQPASPLSRNSEVVKATKHVRMTEGVECIDVLCVRKLNIFCYGHGEEACTTVVQSELYLGFWLAAAAFARFVKLSISNGCHTLVYRKVYDVFLGLNKHLPYTL